MKKAANIWEYKLGNNAIIASIVFFAKKSNPIVTIR